MPATLLAKSPSAGIRIPTIVLHLTHNYSLHAYNITMVELTNILAENKGALDFSDNHSPHLSLTTNNEETLKRVVAKLETRGYR